MQEEDDDDAHSKSTVDSKNGSSRGSKNSDQQSTGVRLNDVQISLPPVSIQFRSPSSSPSPTSIYVGAPPSLHGSPAELSSGRSSVESERTPLLNGKKKNCCPCPIM